MRRIISRAIRLLVKPALSPRVPVTFQRIWGNIIGLTLMGPRRTRYTNNYMAGVPVMSIEPVVQTTGRAVLFLHGGAYVMGGPGSHRKLAAVIGQASNARVLLPDYRLAPEHPHPAALEDVLAVYCVLLQQGQDPAKLSIAGDSAGGGLTLALTLAIREAGLPLPGSLVLLSPWADLTLSGQTLLSHANRDPMLSANWLHWAAQAYAKGPLIASDGCSPLFSNLAGLPPILIQVGAEEILLSDALRLHQRAKQDNVACELKLYEGLWHVFQLHYGVLKEANDAVAEIGQFIEKSLATETEQMPAHTCVN